MKLIIAGGRDFNDAVLFASVVKRFDLHYDEDVVVSGGARGADLYGEMFARMSGIPVARFPADWAKHGRAAGPIRNAEMAEYADALLAFWDGESRGTKNMIETMRREGKPAYVIYTK